jgi:hypothetical protein
MSAPSTKNESKKLKGLLQRYIDSLRTPHIKHNIQQLYLKIYQVAKPATRGTVHDATSGCRFWQLVYAMLWISIQDENDILTILKNTYELKNKNKTYMILYESLLEHCITTVTKITIDRDSNLHRIIFGNRVIECSDHDPCIMPYDETYHGIITDTVGIYYLCMYIKRPNPSGSRDIFDTISHYFTVVHVNGAYYIISSYGCDYICASYDVIPLIMGEMVAFYSALKDVKNEENMKTVTAFYMKYFLHNSNPPYCSDEQVEGDPSLKGKRVQNGPAKELHDVFNQKEGATFHIGVIRGYASAVQKIMMPSLGGSRRIRCTRRTRRNKKRSTRRRV